MTTHNFDNVARLPMPDDNVAIATRELAAGVTVEHNGATFTISHTIMEGHRFALFPIKKGQALLSWQLPFGHALTAIEPGQYVCNEKILEALSQRDVAFELPPQANFKDHMQPYTVDESSFTPGEQIPLADEPATFMGYRREGDRGVGTRNYIIVLAVTAQSAAIAKAVEAHFENRTLPQTVDGIIAITHTEGEGTSKPNNLDLVMRTLSGFMVHPNIGAVLALDYGNGSFTADDLIQFMRQHNYPLDTVLHRFMAIDSDGDSVVAKAASHIEAWMPEVAKQPRQPESVEHISVALQCGGSDAFSGISGNALAGWVAKEVIRHGGRANLAETDELIGAEPYVLNNVKDLNTAQRFLRKVDEFKAYAANHGASAEGNPSGGNQFRGLYNIALKSIGAARKRDPDVRLDGVLDYGAPMADRGYYFMDSPGNDLESIAGQVASGCNMILFITGNGSITNFPFVPTLKFVTTTGRFNMLSNEMDVNAGRYNDGETMDALGLETFQLATAIASGQASKGEQAGHAQVQLWRNWQQTGQSQEQPLPRVSNKTGKAVAVKSAPAASIHYSGFATSDGVSSNRIGLVMPTSLCSGQVARLIANRLNTIKDSDTALGRVDRYVALVHTEGCGSVNAEDIYLNTVTGHLQHGFVRHAVLLEHGCEKTHNDAVRHYLSDKGIDPTTVDWASVQLDGGIENVTEKVTEQFRRALSATDRDRQGTGKDVRVAITSQGPVTALAADQMAHLVQALVAADAQVIIPENASFLGVVEFGQALVDGAVDQAFRTSLDYGLPAPGPGLHIMAAPTQSTTETLAGLGGSGAEVILCYIGDTPVQSHPMVPVLQITSSDTVGKRYAKDLDLVVDEASSDDMHSKVVALIESVLDGTFVPSTFARNRTEFQLTRGSVGVSL